MQFTARACPRCRGVMMSDGDPYVVELSCLSCGYRAYVRLAWRFGTELPERSRRERAPRKEDAAI